MSVGRVWAASGKAHPHVGFLAGSGLLQRAFSADSGAHVQELANDSLSSPEQSHAARKPAVYCEATCR